MGEGEDARLANEVDGGWKEEPPVVREDDLRDGQYEEGSAQHQCAQAQDDVKCGPIRAGGEVGNLHGDLHGWS